MQNILICHGNGGTVARMSACLAQANYVVSGCDDGIDALKQAISDIPDLIVAHFALPRLDGFGLLAALRNQEATKAIPVILISAGTQSADLELERATRLGANDVVADSVSCGDLLEMIDRHTLDRRGALARLAGPVTR
jgi:CheY-like chemotaxis protein